MKKIKFKHFQLRDKITTLLINKGNRNQIETIILQTFKELQKSTKKKTSCLFKLAVLHNYTVLTLKKPKSLKFQRTKLKEVLIPYVLSRRNIRVLESLKSLLLSSKQNSRQKFFLSLKEEILKNLEDKKATAKKQNNFYRLAFLKKNFAHYRWGL